MAILFTNAIIQPNVKKPPAGIIKKSIGLSLIPGISIPIQLPEPRISLTEPIVNNARVKPRPIPSPSRIDGKSLFSAQNNTVYSNQRKEYTESGIERRQIALQNKAYESYEACDNYYK